MSQENRPIIHVENCTVHVHVPRAQDKAEQDVCVVIQSVDKPKAEHFYVPQRFVNCALAFSSVLTSEQAEKVRKKLSEFQKKEAKQ